MTRKNILIAMYRAMDCRYEELDNPSEKLELFLSDLNTYVWADRMTADPAVQADFDEFMDARNLGNDIDPSLAYIITKEFLSEQSEYFLEFVPDDRSTHFDELFEDISIEEWCKLCEIVEREESERS